MTAGILSSIHTPADVHALSAQQLRDLCLEIRATLLDYGKQHGGHIGSNLGVVELTVALHRVFDSPRDRFIFDVSHQSYVHKMLTGRAEAYLDQSRFDEVTGFTNPLESEHDSFVLGHTGTSISLACGLAKTRDMQRGAAGESTIGNVIAIIGDGSLSSAIAFEGLNNAAEQGGNLIIIVNDNEMSIAEDFGGMYGQLAKLRTSNGMASTNRFGDAGLRGLADTIRAHGMGLGLWLEPEVIGVKSPLASMLPDSAFFQRHGVRVCDSGRYLLDFRSPEAREHVTRTVDRLIDDFGAVFFKFDYNTIPGVGTDLNAESVGDGLLEHCRAYVDWLDDLRRRHPDVMIENCGSGAMRADYAQLSRLDLQSTSDQCDPLIYAAIAAGAGMTILPEQQGNWGYAQQEMDDETAVFTLATGVLGRLYLSGFIDRMTEPRLSLVRDAIALHRCVLTDQQHMVPFWPSGLPDFDGDWLAVGLRHVETDMCDAYVYGESAWNEQAAEQNDQQPQPEDKPDYIIVWRRGGTPSVNMPLDADQTIEQVFPNPAEPDHAPNAKPWTIERMDPETVRLNAATSKQPSARIFAIRRRD